MFDSAAAASYHDENKAVLIIDELRRLGDPIDVLQHGPVRTVAEAKALGERLPGNHLKSLLLKDSAGLLYLVCVLEDRNLNIKRLRRQLRAKGNLSFVRLDRVQEILALEPGSLSPLAMLNAWYETITLILDAAILSGEFVNCALMANTATAALHPSDLIRFLRSKEINPLIQEFDPA